jgi:hypothetical protein
MNVTEDGVIALEYDVHQATFITRPAIVSMMGAEVVADVPALEVELVSAERPTDHGSLTLRFIGPELDAVRTLFEGGGAVTLSFAKLRGGPAAVAEETAPIEGPALAEVEPAPEPAAA